jgi:hypothetical protein
MTLSRSGLALFALTLAAAGLAFASARRRVAEPPRDVGRVDAAGAESPEGLRLPPAKATEERRPLPNAPEERCPLPQRAAAPELVRVHGRVLRAGVALESCGVSFRPARDPEGDDADWDLTDPEGRFAVRLPAGRYVVASEEAEDAWIAEVLVPDGPAELELDLRLP